MANRSRQQASRVVVLFSDAEVIVMTGDQAAPLELLAEGLPLEVLAEEPEGEPFLTFFSRLGSPAAYQLAA